MTHVQGTLPANIALPDSFDITIEHTICASQYNKQHKKVLCYGHLLLVSSDAEYEYHAYYPTTYWGKRTNKGTE